MIEITADIRKLERDLARIRRRAIPFALKRATDETGQRLAGSKGIIQREWNRAFSPRRKTFPGAIIRVRRAFVDRARGRISRPTRVINLESGGINDILRDQLEGRTRRPKKSRALLVPEGGRRPRKSARRFVAGGYVFDKRKRGKDKYVGVLVDKAVIPRRFRLRRPLAVARRLMPRLLRKHLRRELAAAERRAGR